jgi:hypothetical protein
MRGGGDRDRVHSLPAHQFEDADQQREAASGDVGVSLLRSCSSAACLPDTQYVGVSSRKISRGQQQAERHSWRDNTAVLICSSLTMAMAVRSAQLNKQRG